MAACNDQPNAASGSLPFGRSLRHLPASSHAWPIHLPSRGQGAEDPHLQQARSLSWLPLCVYRAWYRLKRTHIDAGAKSSVLGPDPDAILDAGLESALPGTSEGVSKHVHHVSSSRTDGSHSNSSGTDMGHAGPQALGQVAGAAVGSDVRNGVQIPSNIGCSSGSDAARQDRMSSIPDIAIEGPPGDSTWESNSQRSDHCSSFHWQCQHDILLHLQSADGTVSHAMNFSPSTADTSSTANGVLHVGRSPLDGLQLETWQSAWVPTLSALWSDYYKANARDASNTELAPWVASRYSRARRNKAAAGATATGTAGAATIAAATAPAARAATADGSVSKD